MYDDIETLIEAITQEDWYHDYQQAYEAVDRNADLKAEVQTMQRLLDEKEAQKKYSAYISLDDINKRISQQQLILSSYEDYQNYQNALYVLNEHLDEISHLIFDGISDDLNVGRMGKLYARHSG